MKTTSSEAELPEERLVLLMKTSLPKVLKKKKKLLDKVELTYPEENHLTYYRHVIYPLCMKEAKHGKNSSQIKSFRTTYLIIPFSSYNLKFRDLDLSPAQGNKGKTEKA